MAQRRVLMYSQDGFGLGHFRRNSNIAQQVLQRDPDTRVLIVADTPAPLFTPTAGIDYVKLPTIVKADTAVWHTGSLDIDIQHTIDLRARTILAIYTAFRPDVVLVDHMPVGALGELKPTLDQIASSPTRPQLLLGLRDVLDEPSVIRRTWKETGAYAYLSCYDAVLVYGCRDIYDLDAAYGLSSTVSNIIYCNYVSRSHARSNGETRAPEAPFVLMMAGGGHDASPLARAFLEASPMMASGRLLESVVVTGPTMSQHEYEELVNRYRAPGVSIERSIPDLTAWVERAAAIVTMGGYNSLCDVLALQKRTLVVPRRGPSAEQRIRARLFARRGLVRMLDPDDLTAANLADSIHQLFSDDNLPHSTNIPPLDGSYRAATCVLDGHGALTHASPVEPEALPVASPVPRSRARPKLLVGSELLE